MHRRQSSYPVNSRFSGRVICFCCGGKWFGGGLATRSMFPYLFCIAFFCNPVFLRCKVVCGPTQSRALGQEGAAQLFLQGRCATIILAGKVRHNYSCRGDAPECCFGARSRPDLVGATPAPPLLGERQNAGIQNRFSKVLRRDPVWCDAVGAPARRAPECWLISTIC